MKTLFFVRRLLRILPRNARRVIETIILGLVAAGLAVFFLEATNLFFEITYGHLLTRSTQVFIFGSLVVIAASSFLVSVLLKRNPEAAGSGIPRLKVSYWKELGYVPFRPVLAKLAAGILSLGGGISLGREGPTLYLTGGITSLLSGLFGRPTRRRRDGLTVGVAAGLAAAFNTPLAAITFVLEELVNDLSNRYLGAVVLASVTGAIVVQAIIGPQPAFGLPLLEETTWQLYFVVPFVAVLATVCGILFDKLTLGIRGAFMGLEWRFKWLLPFFGGLLVWGIGITAFLSTGRVGVFGLGYGDLSTSLYQGIPWRLAGILTVTKLAATIISYGFGCCGGIFSPTLFIGGMCGFFAAGICDHWVPLTSSDQVILAGVGMCTCLCAVVRAPLTAMLIVFEMTHEFALIPPLMIGVLICEGLARLSGRENFYTALLLQEGHELVKVNPPRDLESWHRIRAGDLIGSQVITFKPEMFSDARRILEKSPFRCFPVEEDGVLIGLVTREELQRALETQHPPRIEPAVTCYPNQTIRDLSDRFIESPLGALVVIGEEDGEILGVLTIHDLLRAQAVVLDD
ncbi:MAG: chloride channel protein [Candidatus Hydrogenedentota bacterium]